MTTAIDDNQAAHRAAEELALAVWDYMGPPPDLRPVDTAELRSAAVDCLFASKKLNTRSRLVTAARTLALAVIAYADNSGTEAYRDMARWSRKYETLRIR